MKRFVALLLALSLLMVLSLPALAATKIAAQDNVKFTSNAYGYNKAGSGKTSLILKKGSCAYVNKVSANGKWARIAVDWYSDLDGEFHQMWFSTDCMRLLKPSDSWTPLLFASGGSNKSFQIEKGHKFAPKGLTRVKATGDVNIRKTSSLHGKRLGVLHKGNSLKYLGKVGMDSRGMVFFQVRYKGAKAWVSSLYAKLGKYTKLTDDWFYKKFYGF